MPVVRSVMYESTFYAQRRGIQSEKIINVSRFSQKGKYFFKYLFALDEASKGLLRPRMCH